MSQTIKGYGKSYLQSLSKENVKKDSYFLEKTMEINKMRVLPTVIRVPISSYLADRAITEIMDNHHNKRICQDSLDLYRGAWKFKVNTLEDDIIVFVAILNGDVVGLSAAVIQANNMYNSITVVADACRNIGIGSSLTRAKITEIKRRHPMATLSTKIAKDNSASIKACERAGLKVKEEGVDKKDDKREVPYVILSQ